MKRLFWFFILFVLMSLTACGPYSTELDFRTQYNPNLYPLTLLNPQSNPLPDSSENCMVNEETMPAQGLRVAGSGLRVAGSVGGLSVVLPSPQNVSANPLTLGADLMASFFAATNPIEDSAILVVDDFDGGTYELGKDVFGLTILTDAVFQKLKNSRQYSHGALVMHQVNQIIKGTGAYQLIPQNSNSMVVWRHASSSKYLIVQAVDTGLSDTETIAQMTQDSLYSLANKGIRLSNAQGASIIIDSSVAINMSFALMQCELLADFNWAAGNLKIDNFDDYMTELYRLNKAGFKDKADFVRALIEDTNKPADPLLQLIQNPTYGARKNVYVAASGNYGLNYGMYPANWSEVISVSGSGADKPEDRQTTYFNQGEVMDIGAWFNLSNAEYNSSNVYFAGTSFSAPVVSVFSALDLASSQRCADGHGVSKLAHAGQTDYDYPLRKFANSNSAVEKLCP